MGGIGRVARNLIVVVDPQTHALQPFLESFCQGLIVKPGQNHAGNVETEAPEYIYQPNHVPVIGDA